MTPSSATTPTASRAQAAVSGVVAGAVALGIAELLAGILPGAASPVIAIGDLVISLQPPGAKQLMVDLFGDADKLVLNLAIVAVALAAAAVIGLLARRHPIAGPIGFGGFGLLALAAGLRDPLAEAVTTLVVIGVAVAVAIGVLRLLLRHRGGRASASRPRCPTGDGGDSWAPRSRFGAVAVGSGLIGRALLEGRSVAAAPGLPPAAEPLSPPRASASLDVGGITPIVTPNDEFYRIDTALLIPHPDVSEWQLRVKGLVDTEFALTYDELLAMPLVEQYITIACVSNEVGGDLVGNALWRGVRLKELFDRAGVQPEATQVVGRSVDGFTVGFPLSHAIAADREPLVAVGMNGETLPARHGFPARLIVPGLFGYVSATKWLSEIELTTWEGFDAYWVPLGWSKTGPILTQSRIDTPRDGERRSEGSVPIAGVAWAPDRGVAAVEVRIDEGEWLAAETSTPISDATWVQFVHRWDATPGDHVIQVRATDGDGDVQTDERTQPAPDGARGHHTIRVTVEAA